MKKFLIFLSISLIVFGLGFPFTISALAVSGWAWSHNIGWISFRGPNYGVTLGPTVAGTRNLTGFAWSSHIGWIHFDPAGPFPAAPAHSARVDSPHLDTSTVSGWARVCAVFETGCSGPLHPQRGHWDGWIKMRGPGHGVYVNFPTREFSGWAWSDMVVGWISFRGPGYGVTLVNVPPEAHSPTATVDHCRAPQRYTFSWVFHDPDPGDTQRKFRIQVATNAAFSPLKFDRTITSPVSSYAPLDLFAWNTTYFWRVMVWDRAGAASPWSTTASFRTAVHAPPRPDFSWSPILPVVNDIIYFRDESICFGPGGVTTTCAVWAWHFGPNATPTTSVLRNPTTTFATAGIHSVRLTVTDPTGFSCTTTRSIVIGTAPPEWIEIPPIIWIREFWASIIDSSQRIQNRITTFIINNF